MKRDAAKKYLLSLAVPLVFLVSVLLLFGFGYDVNDDATMAGILSGSYTGTPDSHAIFIHYPLSSLISLLYRLIPGVRWYAVTLLGILLFAMAFLLCQLLSRFPRHPLTVSALFFGVVSLIWIRPVVQFTFSTCGAFLSASAALSYALISKEEDQRPGKLIPVLGLLCLSYCVRDYFVLVTLLFLGIVWLHKYHERMFRDIRCWSIPVVGILSVLLCVGCDKLAYSSPEWQAYHTYNDERSYLMDFTEVPSYKDYPELFDALGYDAPQSACIKNNTYGLLDHFSPEVIHRLYEAVRETEAQTPQPSLVQTAKTTVKTTLHVYLPGKGTDISPLLAASIACPALLLLSAVLLSIADRRHHWPFPLLLMIGLGCLWLYICYNGRYPLRVIQSLRLFSVSASLIGFVILTDLHQSAKGTGPSSRPKWFPILLVCLAAAAALCGFRYTRATLDTNRPQEPVPYYAYAAEHPDNIYIWLPSGALTKLEGSQLNTMPTGSWLYFSPLYWEKMERLGFEDGMNQSVLLRPHVYLVLKEDRDLRKVLGLPKDAPLAYEIIDRMDGGFVVYQFSSIGE